MKPWYLRWFLRVLSLVFYRLSFAGQHHVPASGGALLVSNHLSVIDALLIMAGTPRPIRFLLPTVNFQKAWLRPLLGLIRAIELPSDQDIPRHRAALDQARQAMQRGELIGLFAEGTVSRIGLMLPFRPDMEILMEGVSAPVVPVCIDGVWGSVFSHHAGRFFWKVPNAMPYPVAVAYGAPLPSTATASVAREAVQDLGTEAWTHRRSYMRTVGRSFIYTARRSWFRFAMADGNMPYLSHGSALIRMILVGRKLRAHWGNETTVGIFLPPSVPGVLVNVAALVAGKTVVNLNYTLSGEVLTACAREAGLRVIISSSRFLDRIKTELPLQPLLLEEVIGKPGWKDKLTALLLALAPRTVIEKQLGCKAPVQLDDVAAIIFSSGSTGEPKGVMLSHYNLMSNAEQLGQTFDFDSTDRLLGILPFFHSFGFTATVVAPAAHGIGVVYHPNPLDGKAIGPLMRRFGVTYMMATPSFLQVYLKTCDPADFGSLRLVIAGAEKLPDWLAVAFEEKFRIRPVEGYGCTECSPVVAANTRDYRGTGLIQLGNRRGKIGHPMPGLSLRIVEPDTGRNLPHGQPGLMLVRGPNVMKGYLNRPEKTAEVIRNGWYNTGDIAVVDEDGFLQITDRLSRFSKIGGEMVPHIKVEEKLHQAIGATQLTFAVTGIPDEKKGERLVVLHTLQESALQEVLKKLPQLELPNLWLPKPDQFFCVPELPYLATGKLDLRHIRALALQLSSRKPN